MNDQQQQMGDTDEAVTADSQEHLMLSAQLCVCVAKSTEQHLLNARRQRVG